jgi:hypothetical protein
MRPVLDAVHFEPLVLGGRPYEAFEIAARMQGLAALLAVESNGVLTFDQTGERARW